MAALNLSNGTVTYGDGTTQSSAGFAWTYISGKPTTLAGYGITDTIVKTLSYGSYGGDGSSGNRFQFGYPTIGNSVVNVFPLYQSGSNLILNCYNTNCNCNCNC
jgi:hypothetical protein